MESQQKIKNRFDSQHAKKLLYQVAELSPEWSTTSVDRMHRLFFWRVVDDAVNLALPPTMPVGFFGAITSLALAEEIEPLTMACFTCQGLSASKSDGADGFFCNACQGRGRYALTDGQRAGFLGMSASEFIGVYRVGAISWQEFYNAQRINLRRAGLIHSD